MVGQIMIQLIMNTCDEQQHDLYIYNTILIACNQTIQIFKPVTIFFRSDGHFCINKWAGIVNYLEVRQINDYVKNIIGLPEWVSGELFFLLQSYLNSGNVKFLKEQFQNTEVMILLLRLGDFLKLNLFHQSLIFELIIPGLNETNCISYLQETHKKLRNLQNGNHCWYQLLNQSINYLSTHIFEVYQKIPRQLQNMHDKILNEVLDRSIRILNNNEGTKSVQYSTIAEKKSFLFDLIMRTKGVNSIDSLCFNLRQQIQNRKINPKIHAKLSWKLQNLQTLAEKTTKKFKFLDFQWQLEALRNQNGCLSVRLKFMPSLTNKSQSKVGVFYTKLIWNFSKFEESLEKDDYQAKNLHNAKTQENLHENIGQEQSECPIKVHYIDMECTKTLQVVNIDKNMQKRIGNEKIELSIYCSMEQIYSFVLNYTLNHVQQLQTQGKLQFIRLNEQQLMILTHLSKKSAKYNQALIFTQNLKNKSEQISSELLEGYPIQTLSENQLYLLNSMKKSEKIESNLSLQNFPPKLKLSLLNDNLRESKQRPLSRSRARIFEKIAPQNKLEVTLRQTRKAQVAQMINITKFLHDKNSTMSRILSEI